MDILVALSASELLPGHPRNNPLKSLIEPFTGGGKTETQGVGAGFPESITGNHTDADFPEHPQRHLRAIHSRRQIRKHKKGAAGR